MAGEIAIECVPVPTRQIHVRGARRRIELPELQSQALRVSELQLDEVRVPFQLIEEGDCGGW